ncbi:uncharacterized protein UV8b_06007 [Ustilaginoidea virens]|nr:uncharacterized protein UV8b_06007 [Ustilaginoidea virens]QUC21764.1 hypothetical protein UV8b_06007 [Ustilaginoidea virens]
MESAMSAPDDRQDTATAELSGNSYYPPPPPGPPPAQAHSQTQPSTQQQHHTDQQSSILQSQQQPNPPQEHDSSRLQSQNPYLPRPQDKPSTSQQQQQQHQQQQQQQQYSIPAYNPANPVFAPPPAQSGASVSTAPQDAQQLSSQPPSSQLSSAQLPHEDAEHGQKKPSWGGRFKNMLSAGAAAPINSLAHKLGSQSFLPETLDKECDKAASILKSFCTKGVYADDDADQPPTSTDPKAEESTGGIVDPTKEKPKKRVIVTIPPKVISRAVGLAIFTTLRAGFQVSGATGSGILIARLPDGTWSPPSGIQVHSLGGGFQIGLDIYDCVCVINSKEALAAFMNTRVSLGSDLAVVAGPYGVGGAVDFGTAVQRGRDGVDKQAAATSATPAVGQTGATAEAQSSSTLKPGPTDASKRRSLSSSAFKPVFSYVKSRGFYAGVQVDGTVVVERKDANAAFYGAPVAVQQILRGQVPAQGPQNMSTWPVGAKGLLETLKGAEADAVGRHARQQAETAQASHGQSAAPGAIPGATEKNHASGLAQGSSGAPPAYVDDGSHAHVGDVKYA